MRRYGITLRVPATLLSCATFLVAPLLHAEELQPQSIRTPLGQNGPRLGLFSARTLVLGIEIDRERAELLRYTVKPRPFVSALEGVGARAYLEQQDVELEVVLFSESGTRHTRRVDVGPICLSHGSETEPHVTGDRIRVHRDSFVVELPEVAGLDRVELAFYEQDQLSTTRRSLGQHKLDRARFDPAGLPVTYEDLVVADADDRSTPVWPSASDVLWPESFGDGDLYQIYGDPAEGDRRINITIVPDGYRYTEKAQMEAHADTLVNYFRSKVPYSEHDPFMNYTLVYAYSPDSGTDQCDCAIEANTAMGSRFPNQTPVCGHSDNRCLYYGGACDTSGTGNIIAAELRAPFHDETILMVNTSRYGGCGGLRAAYSAGNGSAIEIAVHEVGHSLGGLADEYAYISSCGFSAGEINTSKNAINGAWPEWISTLGAPKLGAEYYQQCIYRPQANCNMRALGQEFCPVCNQHWSLLTYGHPRVSPTAPIESASPAGPVAAWVDVPVDFVPLTRLSQGSATASHRWTLTGPGFPSPTLVGMGPSLNHAFTQEGSFTLEVTVTADTNFVKPAKVGANRDTYTWNVEATLLLLPGEISPPGSAEPLRFVDRQTLVWEDGASQGAFTYSLYRGDIEDLAGEIYGACLLAGLPSNQAAVADDPPAATGWFYLVAGDNPIGEGPLGASSAGAPRHSALPCP